MDPSCVAEIRLYPDESRILELSSKAPGWRPEVTIKTRLFLDMRGVDPCGDQQIRTCAAP
jgi:hypothetical protein